MMMMTVMIVSLTDLDDIALAYEMVNKENDKSQSVNLRIPVKMISTSNKLGGARDRSNMNQDQLKTSIASTHHLHRLVSRLNCHRVTHLQDHLEQDYHQALPLQDHL